MSEPECAPDEQQVIIVELTSKPKSLRVLIDLGITRYLERRIEACQFPGELTEAEPVPLQMHRRRG